MSACKTNCIRHFLVMLILLLGSATVSFADSMCKGDYVNKDQDIKMGKGGKATICYRLPDQEKLFLRCQLKQSSIVDQRELSSLFFELKGHKQKSCRAANTSMIACDITNNTTSIAFGKFTSPQAFVIASEKEKNSGSATASFTYIGPYDKDGKALNTFLISCAW